MLCHMSGVAAKKSFSVRSTFAQEIATGMAEARGGSGPLPEA